MFHGAGLSPFALGRIVNTVSLAFSRTPAALATPSGGEAINRSGRPCEFCFPLMVSVTVLVDAL